MRWGSCYECGTEKLMHYKEWCPRCEPPKPEYKLVADLVKIKNQLEFTNPNFNSDKFWKKMYDQYEFKNDSHFTYYIEHFSKAEQVLLQDVDVKIFDDYLISMGCNVGDSIILEVSW